MQKYHREWKTELSNDVPPTCKKSWGVLNSTFHPHFKSSLASPLGVRDFSCLQKMLCASPLLPTSSCGHCGLTRVWGSFLEVFLGFLIPLKVSGRGKARQEQRMSAFLQSAAGDM